MLNLGFPASAKVQVLNSVTKLIVSKKISSLNINDFVLVMDDKDNSIKFSRLIAFLDRIENIKADFIRLFYESDYSKFITLTPKHLIWVLDQRKSYFEYKTAESVLIGDHLQFYESNLNMTKIVNVYKIERLQLNQGIYAPLTQSGTLLIDNIKVSCYSIIKNHYVAQYFYNVLNFLNHFISINFEDYSRKIFNLLTLIKLDYLILNV